MFIVALCPTFRHPELLANSVALWEMQDYPAEKRMLFILDDDPTFDDAVSEEGRWVLGATKYRRSTISSKYNEMLGWTQIRRPVVDAILVWEDDDIYFPNYVSAHAKALENAEYSKPAVVLTDYLSTRQKQRIVKESAVGRFHSTIGARMDLIRRVGGWPDTKRADFDQQLMSKLYEQANRVVSPWGYDAQDHEIPFIYRWHSGAAHCQSTMRSPDDETWYDRGEQAYKKVPFVGKLEPKLDDFTKGVLNERAVKVE